MNIMNNQTLSFRQLVLIIFLPLAVIFFIIALLKTQAEKQYIDTLSTAATYDLLFTIPFVYFLLIRKTTISNFTVIPVFILMMSIASFIVPPEHSIHLIIIKNYFFPIIETVFIVFIITKTVKQIRIFKQKKLVSQDTFSILKETLNYLLPKTVANIFQLELGVIYFALFKWRTKKSLLTFTYHKNGILSILGVLIFMIFIETFVMHILLIRWNIYAAWIFTSISIYSAFQIFGLIKSLITYPVKIQKDSLILRYGFLRESIILLDQIQKVEFTSSEISKNKEIKIFSPFDTFESPNIIIHLKNENTINTLWNKPIKYKSLAIYIDDKNNFINTLNKYV
ncbi:MAG: hypothetical protein OEZ22_01275 [Spirochaetia bacterium]|nr:hypothetical protein [Spirochaetia bacterium]